MALGFNLKAFLKSPEGVQRIEEQRPFIAHGDIWQGLNQCCFRCYERQLTDDEITALPDLDETKDQVWFVRNQRLGGRHERKRQEYRKRNSELRTEKNTIRDSMRKDKEDGMPFSEVDKYELTAIDKRMLRLVEFEGDEREVAESFNSGVKPENDNPLPELSRIKTEAPNSFVQDVPSELRDKGVSAPEDLTQPTPPSKPSTVAMCTKESPPGHRNPKKWMTGHQMACPKCKALKATA